VNVRWLSAFLDYPADRHAAGVAFWEEVTGYRLSAPRGTDDEFATLVPAYGDDYLRVQRVGDGAPRIHLDLHVDDLGERPGGASVVAEHDDYVTLRSPGGLVFCLVPHPGGAVPAARTWPDGRRSRLDQVCLDVPPSTYDDELDFWHRTLAWEVRDPQPGSPFDRLLPPGPTSLEVLVQRLDDEQDAVSAHLDWASTDRPAEVAAHVAAGATEGASHGWWTVMTDPAGMTYCVTRREPR
jgi:hypothetical protein